MARCLFTVWPIPGHYNPSLALAHELRRQGHDVRFYTGERARSVIEGEGFGVFPFKRVDERLVDRIFFDRNDVPQWRQLLAQRSRLYDWLIGTLDQQVDDIGAVVDQWRPDMVICDISMWAPFVVLAETDKIKVAIYQFQIGCLLPGSAVPPVGLGLSRPRGALGRAVTRAANGAMAVATRHLRDGANAVRAKYGLPALQCSPTAHAGTMPLYLVTSAPVLDYQRTDLPASVHYVGACIWDRPRHEAAPDWLGDLAQGHPLVHVTEGTIHARRPLLLSAAAEGLAYLPMNVVMTTGAHRDPEELGLGALAPNVRVAAWVPHSLLLPMTDVVVTTGGAGTVLSSLMAGVPLLIVPTEWDKPESARRVVDAGAGLSLSPSRCTPARLRDAIERLVADPSYRTNAKRIRDGLLATGGAKRAAELIGSLATPPVDNRTHFEAAVG